MELFFFFFTETLEWFLPDGLGSFRSCYRYIDRGIHGGRETWYNVLHPQNWRHNGSNAVSSWFLCFFHSGGYYSSLDTGLNISKGSSGSKSVMSPICSKQSAKAVRRSYLHAAWSAPCCAPVLPVACRMSFVLMSLAFCHQLSMFSLKWPH